MINKTFDIVLRIQEGNYINTDIKVVANDKDVNIFKIKLFDGVNEINYLEVDHATLAFAKSDGATVLSPNITPTESGITYKLGTTEVASPGVTLASVQLYGPSGERLTTARFTFTVIKDILDQGAVESASEFPPLEKFIGEVEEAQEKLDDAVTTYESMIKTSNIILKPPVANYAAIATTYPSPKNGWTTRAIDTGRLYRYNSTIAAWEWIDTITTSAYDALLNEIANPTYLAPETFYGIGSINALSKTALLAKCELAGQVVNNLFGSIGDFETDSDSNGIANGWTSSGSGTVSYSIDTTKSLYGSKSQKIVVTAGSSGIRLPSPMKIVSGNKYYFRASALNDVICGVKLGATEYEMVYGNLSFPASTTWKTLSSLFTSTGTDFHLYTHSDIGTVNYDGMMLVDLTARFGAGNEPTKAWCDANLSFVNGLANTQPQELVVTGKNLLKFKNGSFTNNGVTVTISDGVITLNGTATQNAYIKISRDFAAAGTSSLEWRKEKLGAIPAGNVTLSFTDVSGSKTGNQFFGVYDNVAAIIWENLGVQKTLNFIEGKNTSCIIILFYSGDTFNNYRFKPQLEIGSSATASENYTETVIQSPEIRTVNSAIRDIVDIIAGKLTQNVGKAVFDGSADENWSLGVMVDSTNTLRFNITVQNLKAYTAGDSASRLSFASTFNAQNNTADYIYVNDVEAQGVASNYYSVRVLKSKLSTPDVAGFKALLSANPVTVQYQLATPKEIYYPTKAIMAVPGGMVYTNPKCTDVGLYSNKISIEQTAYPIKSLKYVNKIDVNNGTLTPIDISTCTIAGDGLSYTIAGGLPGEYYDYGWYYDSSLSTIPAVTISCASDLKAAVDEATKGVKRNSDAIERVDNEVEALKTHMSKVFYTELGGIAIPLINKTGATSVKGMVVRTSPTVANAVSYTDTSGAGLYSPVGVIYNSGVADGEMVWVVIAGIAEVYAIEGYAVALGDGLRTTTGAPGKAGSFLASPTDAEHWREIGHTLEAKTIGDANRLVKAVLHFN